MLERQAVGIDLWPTRAAFRGCVSHEVHAKEQIQISGQPEPVVVWTVGEAMDLLRITIHEALRKRIILANSADIRTFCTIVPQLVPGRGCYGYPDALDCRNGTIPVIVEAKYVSSRLPARTRAADEIQAAAYLAGVIELGFADAYAEIIYRDRSGRQTQVRMPYTAELERRLKAIARRFDSVEKGLEDPIPRDLGACRFCRFRYACVYGSRSLG